MCLLKKRKHEQIMKSKINSIIESTDYKLVRYKKNYKHRGNYIIKFVSESKMNIKIIFDGNDIVLNGKCFSKLQYVDLYKEDKDILLLDFIKLIFNIIKCDDWRLTKQENYLLFAKLKEIFPIEYMNKLDNLNMFHEHCEFCGKKIEENKEEKCYCTVDDYHWICKECYNDFKEYFKFKIK